MSRGDSSVAHGISRAYVRRTRLLMLFVNLAALALCCAGFCYVQDSAFAGERSPIKLAGMLTRSIALKEGRIIYTAASGGARYSADATAFVATLACLFALLLAVEWVLIAIFGASGAGMVKKRLKPLYRLASAAARLSDEDYRLGEAPKRAAPAGRAQKNETPFRAGGIGPERLHSLENAIEGYSPDGGGGGLHTGYSDLAGIENAVNRLLERTRDSYSRQVRFVSDASHELRTPIAVIKGYADMLERWGKRDEKVLGEAIEAIRSEAEHMNALVEQLLFLARGDDGRQKLSKKRFSLSDTAREVYEEQSMIDPRHLWKLDDGGAVEAFGDPGLIKQAVRILADNAVKYTPEGEAIAIRAGCEPDGVFISVRDSGIGIGDGDISHVFERFYRSDLSRARESGGTGLGLSIAKWIVDRHGGYFDIASLEGVGTRFTLHLPQAPREGEVGDV